jgi:hypothetical protein
MKHVRALFVLIAVLSLAALASAVPSQHGGSGVKEYDAFHDLLRVLQHDALPANDMKTIREKAPDLIKLGEPIVKMGVPHGTKEENVAKFKEGLKNFEAALKKYGADAKNGSDENLKTSYIAVHDTYEELADILPRKSH